MMDAVGSIGGLVFLALLLEGAIEFFVAEPLKKAGRPTWFVRYVALVAGIAAAFGFRADLMAMVGLESPDWIAFIATGLVIGRGSNYLSDLVGRFGGTDSRRIMDMMNMYYPGTMVDFRFLNAE